MDLDRNRRRLDPQIKRARMNGGERHLRLRRKGTVSLAELRSMTKNYANHAIGGHSISRRMRCFMREREPRVERRAATTTLFAACAAPTGGRGGASPSERRRRETQQDQALSPLASFASSSATRASSSASLRRACARTSRCTSNSSRVTRSRLAEGRPSGLGVLLDVADGAVGGELGQAGRRFRRGCGCAHDGVDSGLQGVEV